MKSVEVDSLSFEFLNSARAFQNLTPCIISHRADLTLKTKLCFIAPLTGCNDLVIKVSQNFEPQLCDVFKGA